MKTKFLYTLILTVISIIGYAQDGYLNKSEAENKNENGLKEGKWILYADSTWNFNVTDESKAVYYRLAIYKNGKLFGTARDFYKSGKLQFEGKIMYYDSIEKKDVKDGVCKWYYEDGSLTSEINYIDGLECGGKRYFKSGKLKYESAPCIEGKATGLGKTYFESGKLKMETPIINGKKSGMQKWYYETGEIQFESPVTDDKYNGITKEYYESGKIKGEYTWVKGVRNYTKEYYENGKLKCEVPYINGKRNGVQKNYYESGELQIETPCTDDKFNGITKEYFKDGKLKGEFSWTNGKRDYEKEYYENGNLKYEVPYINGKKNGVAKTYSSKGKVVKETVYDDDREQN